MTPGFPIIYKSSGLKVYKRKTVDNKLEFVTIVNINKAKIENVPGGSSKSDHNKIYKKSLTEFWQDEKKINDNTQQLKVITNGTYFSNKNNPTGIAFGLKLPGRLPIYGYGAGNEYIGQIRTLKHFGVRRSIMLDGGGSTGLILEGKSLIHTNSTLPHAFAIYSRRNK